MGDTPGSSLEFLRTPIQGLLVVQRNRIEDSRGFLSRLYSSEAFESAGVRKPIVQINHTYTRQDGAVRGMHFQLPPFAETKIVTCLRGEVFDVAVDLRRGSPSFLRWHGERLSSSNRRSLVVPEGFAHGFQALTGDCELIYLHTANYQPAAERGVRPTDPRLSILWPLQVADLSDRDRSHPLLTGEFEGVEL